MLFAGIPGNAVGQPSSPILTAALCETGFLKAFAKFIRDKLYLSLHINQIVIINSAVPIFEYTCALQNRIK
jgi:hypothetical protein